MLITFWYDSDITGGDASFGPHSNLVCKILIKTCQSCHFNATYSLKLSCLTFTMLKYFFYKPWSKQGFFFNLNSKSSQSQIVYSCTRATGLPCKYINTHIQFFLNSNILYIKIVSCKIVLSSCVSLLKLWIDGGFKKHCEI